MGLTRETIKVTFFGASAYVHDMMLGLQYAWIVSMVNGAVRMFFIVTCKVPDSKLQHQNDST